MGWRVCERARPSSAREALILRVSKAGYKLRLWQLWQFAHIKRIAGLVLGNREARELLQARKASGSFVVMRIRAPFLVVSSLYWISWRRLFMDSVRGGFCA